MDIDTIATSVGNALLVFSEIGNWQIPKASLILWCVLTFLVFLINYFPFLFFFRLISTYGVLLLWTVVCVVAPVVKNPPKLVVGWIQKKLMRQEYTNAEVNFSASVNILSKVEINTILTCAASEKKIAKKGQVVAAHKSYQDRFFYVECGSLDISSKRFIKGHFARVDNLFGRLSLAPTLDEVVSSSRTRFYEIRVKPLHLFLEERPLLALHFYKFVSVTLILEFVTVARGLTRTPATKKFITREIQKEKEAKDPSNKSQPTPAHKLERTETIESFSSQDLKLHFGIDEPVSQSIFL